MKKKKEQRLRTVGVFDRYARKVFVWVHGTVGDKEIDVSLSATVPLGMPIRDWVEAGHAEFAKRLVEKSGGVADAAAIRSEMFGIAARWEGREA